MFSLSLKLIKGEESPKYLVRSVMLGLLLKKKRNVVGARNKLSKMHKSKRRRLILNPASTNEFLSLELSGVGNRRTVRELVEIVQAEGPKIVFLSETWSSRKHMEKVKRELDFDGLFIVPSDGKGGGLALLWKLEVAVWVDSFSKFHIDAIVNGGG